MSKPTTRYTFEDSIKTIEALNSIKKAHKTLTELGIKYGPAAGLCSDEMNQQMQDINSEIHILTNEFMNIRKKQAIK